jgi:hypothetical protein
MHLIGLVFFFGGGWVVLNFWDLGCSQFVLKTFPQISNVFHQHVLNSTSLCLIYALANVVVYIDGRPFGLKCFYLWSQ